VVVVVWLGVVVVVWLGVVVVVWLGVAPAGVVVWMPAWAVDCIPAGVLGCPPDGVVDCEPASAVGRAAAGAVVCGVANAARVRSVINDMTNIRIMMAAGFRFWLMGNSRMQALQPLKCLIAFSQWDARPLSARLLGIFNRFCR
jgi:hypothetical protein